ncbi:MAG: DUF3048 domain-containing protein [Candidatus Kerfeldbacteria bacterium CG_4_10_14_0_8_um_filter_42_10]|uniref:DUF3048 domain-containing protein n=1 Tax=Candidatus Kerfeldbacteria bacterium CG_4_10_14_0_8_um_filter_42_10 TaxID=2014248 RepID=A0A2M7RGU6_9BACT|nr:MAG: DUF3048 domain-containing protein [Candidatus Kerfeldbacteria bacterium CG_4_10_14_0_8_um_filter_42_10]
METNKNKNNLFQITPLKIQLLVMGGVLILGGIIAWVFIGTTLVQAISLFSDQADNQVAVKTLESEPESLTEARLLDGRIVAKSDYDLLPVGVMIENLPSVRPQSGLSRAQVVYEALVEGFSTRFLVVYDPKELSDTIGPVRSARPYYLEWISELNGLYVHAGGSPDALAAVDGLGIRDLNALSKGQYFWRDHAQAAPHNLYTSKNLLDLAVRDLEYQDLKSEFEPWLYQDDPLLAERPEDAKKVIIKFSGYSYEVEYQYDRESDEYLRFNAGQAHLDRNTGEQLRAKNVIVVEIPPVVDIGEKGRLTFDISGEGRALVARHGEAIEGTWKKPDRLAKTRFYDQTGKEIELGRGSTWIHIVPETQEFGVE